LSLLFQSKDFSSFFFLQFLFFRLNFDPSSQCFGAILTSKASKREDLRKKAVEVMQEEREEEEGGGGEMWSEFYPLNSPLPAPKPRRVPIQSKKKNDTSKNQPLPPPMKIEMMDEEEVEEEEERYEMEEEEVNEMVDDDILEITAEFLVSTFDRMVKDTYQREVSRSDATPLVNNPLFNQSLERGLVALRTKHENGEEDFSYVFPNHNQFGDFLTRVHICLLRQD